MNSITIIHPYVHKSQWVFDDDKYNLVREPFVAGSDNIIERLTENIRGSEDGFTLTFSAVPFPGHQITLKRLREEGGGHWYHCVEFDMIGWLCPALFHYFSTAPDMIYVEAH